jgi:hypothetical protein
MPPCIQCSQNQRQLNIGDEALYAAAAPLLGAMGKATFFLGQTGAGARMKLVVNAIMGVMMGSIAEGAWVVSRVCCMDLGELQCHGQQALNVCWPLCWRSSCSRVGAGREKRPELE